MNEMHPTLLMLHGDERKKHDEIVKAVGLSVAPWLTPEQQELLVMMVVTTGFIQSLAFVVFGSPEPDTADPRHAVTHAISNHMQDQCARWGRKGGTMTVKALHDVYDILPTVIEQVRESYERKLNGTVN